MKKLTPKQQNFCELYVTLGNASEAYRRAYDVRESTTTKSVNEQASKLFGDLKIYSMIEELRGGIKEDNKITRQTLIDYHQRMIDAWQELWKLGQKEKLTADQKTRFYLLKELVKGSDMRGSTDSIAKLTGLNEPDKIEHKHEIIAHKTKWS